MSLTARHKVPYMSQTALDKVQYELDRTWQGTVNEFDNPRQGTIHEQDQASCDKVSLRVCSQTAREKVALLKSDLSCQGTVRKSDMTDSIGVHHQTGTQQNTAIFFRFRPGFWF
jgi:hypothetical protein